MAPTRPPAQLGFQLVKRYIEIVSGHMLIVGSEALPRSDRICPKSLALPTLGNSLPRDTGPSARWQLGHEHVKESRQ